MTSDELAGCLTVAEAAARLRVSVDTVRGWIQRGELQPVFNVGSTLAPRYRIPPRAVLERFRVVAPMRLG